MGRRFVPVSTLVVGTAGAVGNSATAYSESRKLEKSLGFCNLFLISTAGSITVTQQCSMNGINWYDPIDSEGNALGAVCAALLVTTGTWIQFSPVMTPYIRFKVVEGGVAPTVVTLKLMFQEE